MLVGPSQHTATKQPQSIAFLTPCGSQLSLNSTCLSTFLKFFRFSEAAQTKAITDNSKTRVLSPVCSAASDWLQRARREIPKLPRRRRRRDSARRCTSLRIQSESGLGGTKGRHADARQAERQKTQSTRQRVRMETNDISS